MKRSWQPERKKQEGRTFKNPDYHTHAWRKLRAAHLEANPLCVSCKKQKRVTFATVVDHIQNVASGRSQEERDYLMWNPNNLQSMCASCHNSKSGKEKYT